MKTTVTNSLLIEFIEITKEAMINGDITRVNAFVEEHYDDFNEGNKLSILFAIVSRLDQDLLNSFRIKPEHLLSTFKTKGYAVAFVEKLINDSSLNRFIKKFSTHLRNDREALVFLNQGMWMIVAQMNKSQNREDYAGLLYDYAFVDSSMTKQKRDLEGDIVNYIKSKKEYNLARKFLKDFIFSEKGKQAVNDIIEKDIFGSIDSLALALDEVYLEDYKLLDLLD